VATYTGAWKRSTIVEPKTRLVQPTDPQHLEPDPNPGQPRNWVADTLMPSLPDELLGDQLLQLPLLTSGPIDRTPEDHAYGMGRGAAQTTFQSQDERGEWHGDDRGAVEARRYIAAGSRDGSWNVDIIADTNNVGDSPQTVARRNLTGLEHPENDPYARRAQRIWRWRDRWIDRHMWGAEYRPVRIPNAYTAPAQAPQSNGDQYTSPAPTLAWSGRAGIGSGDQFVTPQERRTPRPWDEPMTTDAIGGTSNFGLGSWGL
jgi:hypothetical protein